MNPSSSTNPIAILGAGVLGSCSALCLASSGFQVVLFDQEAQSMSGASRWNEGKIHLGFLYAASGNLDTAKRILTGGLLFKPILERLLETSISELVTPVNDHYLLHRHSVVAPEAAQMYFKSVEKLVKEHPLAKFYLANLSTSTMRPLTTCEINEIANPELIRTGFSIPERSVETQAVANALVQRVQQDPRISCFFQQRITGLENKQTGSGHGWTVMTKSNQFGPFRAVVNALWQGRPIIDKLTTGYCDRYTHHRYRVSAFIRVTQPLNHPSAVISAGPFGDVKNYGGNNFYVSWYPAGLLLESDQIEPPAAPQLSSLTRQVIAEKIRNGLSPILSYVDEIFKTAKDVRIEGGWVYAQGKGRLDDPDSSLHQRSLIGLSQQGSYFTVDTGKYSMAPYLAEEVARRVNRYISTS